LVLLFLVEQINRRQTHPRQGLPQRGRSQSSVSILETDSLWIAQNWRGQNKLLMSGVSRRSRTFLMPNQTDIQITRPEDRELEAKRGELAALEANLAERELQLASLRAELS
jgi:hypothetical protein